MLETAVTVGGVLYGYSKVISTTRALKEGYVWGKKVIHDDHIQAIRRHAVSHKTPLKHCHTGQCASL